MVHVNIHTHHHSILILFLKNLSLASTKAIIVADSEGKKIFAKYYSQDHASLKDLNAFEKKLFEKTQKTPGFILVYLIT